MAVINSIKQFLKLSWPKTLIYLSVIIIRDVLYSYRESAAIVSWFWVLDKLETVVSFIFFVSIIYTAALFLRNAPLDKKWSALKIVINVLLIPVLVGALLDVVDIAVRMLQQPERARYMGEELAMFWLMAIFTFWYSYLILGSYPLQIGGKLTPDNTRVLKAFITLGVLALLVLFVGFGYQHWWSYGLIASFLLLFYKQKIQIT